MKTFAENGTKSISKNKSFFKRHSKGKSDFFFQPKLTIGPADDAYEREADAVASQVMRMSNDQGTVQPKISPVKIQRKCAKCEEEEKKMAQRKTKSPENEAPSEVHQAINSGGNSLDSGTRSFMENRFGYDFGNVKIHTDHVAAKSANSINALAYTSGNNIVFNQGQYSPGTDKGKRLLAHELTHVVQQNSGIQRKMIQRRVASRLVRCTSNVASAPADPVAVLTRIDARAMDMATQISQSLNVDSVTARSGIPATPSVTFQSYITNFGLPNAVGSRFMNRLTGTVVATQEIAMSQELHILSRRFAMIAHLFSQFINYFCSDIGQTRRFGGCSNGDCNIGDAWSCRGIGAIFICPSFWLNYSEDQQASVLIHEATHIIWGITNPREVGQIGDETLRGAGRNYNIAGCYEQMVPDFFGFDSVATCPAPG